jgi:HD-GYP domain-containing protein (c-di-GMP phosphodiesterase class II)
LGARIMAVADSYDAMTSDRAYRKAMPADKAVSILKEGRDKQWHGEIVNIFMKII